MQIRRSRSIRSCQCPPPPRCPEHEEDGQDDGEDNGEDIGEYDDGGDYEDDDGDDGEDDGEEDGCCFEDYKCEFCEGR